jgi:CRISPR/Cas system-associated exonuclease Cas4 (RecB family)
MVADVAPSRHSITGPTANSIPGNVAYNPAQQTVVELLGRSGVPIEFPAAIGTELERELEDALTPVAAELSADDPLWVSKHALATVHACEAHHVAAASQPFEWNVPAARGTVAHKAIELGVHWQGEPEPMTLVDEAFARLIGDDRQGVQRFLSRLTSAERADLRGEAVDLVAAFQECFPPLKAAWVPVTESRVRVELCGSRIILSGKTDLTLGRSAGRIANKVIIDLKSGRPALGHRDDLRFYALLETIKLGLPPRKLATYYLETGRPQPEEVTVALLRSAVRRTIDGVEKIFELAQVRREPGKAPGPACRWCPLLEACDEGQAELAHDVEDGVASW